MTPETLDTLTRVWLVVGPILGGAAWELARLAWPFIRRKAVAEAAKTATPLDDLAAGALPAELPKTPPKLR